MEQCKKIKIILLNQIYKVRKSWGNIESQKGAFSDLNNDKKCAD